MTLTVYPRAPERAAPLTMAQVEGMLPFIDGAELRDVWLQVGMGMKAEFGALSPDKRAAFIDAQLAKGMAPEVLRRCGADVIVLSAEPDGYNINAGCGSTHLENLQQAVVAHGADFGVAFDGDADRCLAVDHEGIMVDGDQIMGMLAVALKESGHQFVTIGIAWASGDLSGEPYQPQAHDFKLDGILTDKGWALAAPTL